MTPAEIVAACQNELAHAWVVRAFVRHSDEAEEFPEITDIGRAVFDLTRALETRAGDPPAYFKMLQKKLGRFRRATEEFAELAPRVSAHTNFEQAVISIRASAERLETLLNEGRACSQPD